MRGQCIDLPPDSAPWLYAVADLPTTANEQSISLRCLCSFVTSFYSLSLLAGVCRRRRADLERDGRGQSVRVDRQVLPGTRVQPPEDAARVRDGRGQRWVTGQRRPAASAERSLAGRWRLTGKGIEIVVTPRERMFSWAGLVHFWKILVQLYIIIGLVAAY